MELIPAVVQHYATGQVLMVAYMNDVAVRKTRESGFVHFWSRSRGRLWRKGETSGNTLRVVEIRLDCDNDCMLVRAAPSGPACHTGHQTCFFTDSDEGAPASTLDGLYRVVLERKHAADGVSSYTRQLLDAGSAKIVGKIVEECGEFCAEIPDGPRERAVSECADLFYHVLVGLGSRDIDPSAVLLELARRLGTSGIDEKARRGKGRKPPARGKGRKPPARPKRSKGRKTRARS